MNDDGTMARMPDLEFFAEKHGLKIVSVADWCGTASKRKRWCRGYLNRLADAFGEFRVIIYENQMNGETHVAMVMGQAPRQPSRCSSASKRRMSLLRCSAATIGEQPARCMPLSKRSPMPVSAWSLYLRQRKHLDLVNHCARTP